MLKGARNTGSGTESIDKLSKLFHNRIFKFALLLEIVGLAVCCFDFFLFGRLSFLTGFIFVWVLVLPPFLYIYIKKELREP